MGTTPLAISSATEPIPSTYANSHYAFPTEVPRRPNTNGPRTDILKNGAWKMSGRRCRVSLARTQNRYFELDEIHDGKDQGVGHPGIGAQEVFAEKLALYETLNPHYSRAFLFQPPLIDPRLRLDDAKHAR